jgi:ATP-binding cassette subfamily D (ALD) long-chain fatty acid import protein
VIKYLWSAMGYLLISIPVLFTRQLPVGMQPGPRAALTAANNAVADRTESV